MKNYFLISLFFCALSASAQSNYAVNNDGVDDYVSLPATVAVSQSNTFTVEAWVYWNGTGNGCIYSETVQGNNVPMLSISPRSADGGGIELVLRDNSATGLVLQPAAATVTANTWVYVAIVRTSATNIKTYINGVLKDDATFTAPASWTPTQVNAGIRWRVSKDGPFAGKIEELRIWKTARTQAQIKANMFNKNLSDNASGLVAYYKMNDGSGTTATNSCTNTSSIDGTLTNGPTWAASPIQFGGNALYFDHTDDRVIAPLATTATSNVTIEEWIYHEGSTAVDHLLVSNGVMGTNGYAMYINTQRKLCIQFNAVGVWNTNYAIPSNIWTHIALVIDATGFTVYANGVNVYSNTATPITPTGNFILGFNTVANSQAFDGAMDEVRVWNTARAQMEIQNNMNGEIDPSTPGLALYYTFNQGNAAGDNAGLTTLIDQSDKGINGTLTNFALTGNSSNYVTQNSSLVILPLKWLSLTARKQNTAVLLQWRTSLEVNTNDFWIERSVNGKDWKPIGNVLSKNQMATNNYSYSDLSPESGINYYRIRQNDDGGRYSYSKIVHVNINEEVKPFQLVVNPVADKTLQLQIHSLNPEKIILLGSDGKILWSKEFSHGFHYLSVSTLPKGIYFLKGENYSEKFLLQ